MDHESSERRRSRQAGNQSTEGMREKKSEKKKVIVESGMHEGWGGGGKCTSADSDWQNENG